MKDVLAQMDAAQLEHADIHAGLRLRPGESSGFNNINIRN